MNLADLVPDADVLLAFDPDELGLHILQVLRNTPSHHLLDVEAFTNAVIGNSRAPLAGAYPPSRRTEIKAAITEAWAWLEGQALLLPHPGYVDPTAGPRVLSRKAARLADEADPRRALSAQRLPKDLLHHKIREDVWSLYQRGKYDTAVFEAMKAVEVSVRRAAGLGDKDIGVGLMRKAFDPENGPLTDKATEKGDERRGRACSPAPSVRTKTPTLTAMSRSMIQTRPRKLFSSRTIFCELSTLGAKSSL